MEVKGLTENGVFKDVSFTVHQGEILGFFRIDGRGSNGDHAGNFSALINTSLVKFY